MFPQSENQPHLSPQIEDYWYVGLTREALQDQNDRLQHVDMLVAGQHVIKANLEVCQLFDCLMVPAVQDNRATSQS